jgi:hypothetical protein
MRLDYVRLGTYKTAVDDWDCAILRDEVFASATHSIAQIHRWEQENFEE